MLSRRALPLGLNLLLVGACLFTVLFVVAESGADFTVTKAFYAQIFFKAPSVQIQEVSLIQDSYEAKYVRGMVTVVNTGPDPVRGLGTVTLFDAEAHKIAWGASNSTIIQSGTKYTFKVPLEWVPGAKLTDVSTAQASFTAIKEPPP